MNNHILSKKNHQISNVRVKFIAITEQFILAGEKGEILTPNGDKYRLQSLKGYKNLIKKLQDFEFNFGVIFLEDVTPYWCDRFRIFLNKYKLSKTTTSAYISRIKAVVNRAYKAGLTNRNGYGIRVNKEVAITVFNTVKELKALKEIPLPKGQSVVRDIYLMNCFLGLRVSDLQTFITEPKKYIREIGDNYYLELISKKTTAKSTIPLGCEAMSVLSRYNCDFGSGFSYQYYNLTIKKIAKKAGIKEIVTIPKTIAGEDVRIEKEKWQIMSSHTARRTFASLCILMDMPTQSIMKMMGQKSEQSFQCYVRITEMQNAMKMANHEFFKIVI
ncbi:site-specific integrase [Riemerella anatipestifer]|uniref:site-specific integrase n=1 Tax=Riemerella anatipestifer TaxID=34085 RepID=UPI0030C18005